MRQETKRETREGGVGVRERGRGQGRERTGELISWTSKPEVIAFWLSTP